MELYNGYDNDKQVFAFSPMNNFTDLDISEENFSYDFNKSCYNNINRNNILFVLPTRATMNEKGDENEDQVKEEDKMDLIKQEETYINYPVEKDKIETKKKSSLGRKRREDSGSGEHNKFSEDNLRRKCKHLVLDNTFNFINDKIKEKYNGNIGYGRFIKKLLILNQKQISDASIPFNKIFLNKTLGDIYSEKISSRYTCYNPLHNKLLIEILTNDENEAQKDYFKKLFGITFVDCLKHFRGSIKIEELEGLNGFDNIKSKYEDDSDYLKSLEYYIMHYEEIMNNKRTRKTNKKEKSKNIDDL